MNLISYGRASTYDLCPWFTDDNFSNWIINNIENLGKSICDVGAGTGYMLGIYREFFNSVLAIEPSESMLNIIKDKYSYDNKISFINSFAENISVKDKSYDIAISKSSLHHFIDIDQSISEMARISKNAIVLIEVVAPDKKCLPFLRDIVITKEKNRSNNTLFLEEDLINIISKATNSYRSIHYDQYISVSKWLKNSDLNSDLQNNIYNCISKQNGDIRKLMQIHYNNNDLQMLRRMNLVIGTYGL